MAPWRYEKRGAADEGSQAARTLLRARRANLNRAEHAGGTIHFSETSVAKVQYDSLKA
jgi:hypothetical protein